LWNSCAISGNGHPAGRKYLYTSIEEAIRAKQKDGWVVLRVAASDFMHFERLWAMARENDEG